MQLEVYPDLEYVGIEIVADASRGGQSLSEVSSFLHNFNRLYEISRLAFDERYREFPFKGPLAYERQRPLESFDRLYVTRLSMGSPLHLALLLLAWHPKETIQAIEIFVGMLERLYNIPVEHQRRLADVEAKRALTRLTTAQAQEIEMRILRAGSGVPRDKQEESRSREERAHSYLDRAVSRLNNSDLSVKRIVLVEYGESEPEEPEQHYEK
jgi:hypothetical protein